MKHGGETMINPLHREEWIIGSAVSSTITDLNVTSLEGFIALDWMLQGLSSEERINTGAPHRNWFDRYDHLKYGGWRCSGLNLLTLTDDDWGTFKPEQPRPDFKKEGKFLKYENPPKIPTGVFALKLDLRDWIKISEKHHQPAYCVRPEYVFGYCLRPNYVLPECCVLPFDIFNYRVRPKEPEPILPECCVLPEELFNLCVLAETPAQEIEQYKNNSGAHFWQWLLDNPHLPTIITEGAKKTGCLLTAGYITVGLPGIFNGYRVPKDDQGNKIGNPFLIPELQLLAANGREMSICFDNDVKPNTAKNVRIATQTLARLFKEQGCPTSFITWTGPEKGVDDLIISRGVEYFDELYQSRRNPLSIYQAIKERQSLSKYDHFTFKSQYFSHDLLIPSLPKIIGFKGAKGTGKTQAIIEQVQNAQARGRRVFALTHRIQLALQLCHRFQINHLEDIREKNSPLGKILGYGLCVDSLRPSSKAQFSPNEFEDALVIIDEADQVIEHLLLGGTLKESNRRPEVLLTFQKAMEICLASPEGQVILLSADLSPREIDFIASFGINPTIYCLENLYNPVQENPRELKVYQSPEELMLAIRDEIARDERPAIFLGAQKEQYKYSTTTLEKQLNSEFSERRFLRIDSNSVADPTHRAYGVMSGDLNSVLSKFDGFLGSPTVETGISIDIKNYFSGVYSLFNGVQSINGACQSLERVRDHIDRHIYVSKTSSLKIGNGSTNAKELIESQTKLHSLEESFTDICAAEGFATRQGNLLNPIFIETWAAIAAQRNLEALHYADVLLEKLADYGYEVVYVNNTPEEKEKAALVKQKALETSQKLYDAHCQRVAMANNPSNQEYQRLEETKEKTEAEQEQLKKGQICRRSLLVEGEVNPHLVKEFDKGIFVKWERYYYLFEGTDFLISKARERLDNKLYLGIGFLPDLPTLTVEVKALEKVISPLLDPEKTWNRDNLTIWALEYVFPYRKELELILKVKIDPEKDGKSPLALAQKFLKLIDLKFICSKRPNGGKRMREYKLLNVLLPLPKEQLSLLTEKQIQTREILQKLEQTKKQVLARWLSRDLQSEPSTFNYIYSNNPSSGRTEHTSLNLPVEPGSSGQDSFSEYEQTPNSDNNLSTFTEPSSEPSTFNDIYLNNPSSGRTEQKAEHLPVETVSNGQNSFFEEEQTQKIDNIISTNTEKSSEPSTFNHIYSNNQKLDETSDLLTVCVVCLGGINYQDKKEEFSILAAIWQDYGSLVKKALSFLTDITQKITLTQWLEEL